jgi:Domain of unknown function (DUF4129)
VGVLILAWLLPRPATPYSLAAFVTKLGSPKQQASRRAPETSEGAEGRSQSKAQGDHTPRADQTAANKDGHPSQSDGGSGKAQSAGGRPQSSANALSVPPSLAMHAQKWLSYLVAGVVLLVLLLRFWPEISAGMKSLLESLSILWTRREKRPRQRRTRSGLEPSESAALLPNPFHTGRAEQMSLAELVRYSYEGLRAWAQSRGFTPRDSETPLELAERLSQTERALTNEILLLSSYYSHVAYASQSPPDECRAVLRRLWSVIGSGL